MLVMTDMRKPPFKTKYFLAGVGMFFVGAYLLYTYPLPPNVLDGGPTLGRTDEWDRRPGVIGLLLLGVGGFFAVSASSEYLLGECIFVRLLGEKKDQEEE